MAGPILIVDDESSIQETLKVILESVGHQVITASDGLDAIARVEEQLPELVLLDVMMPRMDGHDFINELERRGLRSAIPILLLSASGRVREHARRMGVEHYLEKPFDLYDLLDKVDCLTRVRAA